MLNWIRSILEKLPDANKHIEKFIIKYVRPFRKVYLYKNIRRATAILIIGLLVGLGLVLSIPELEIDFIFSAVPTFFASIIGVYISYSIVHTHLINTTKQRVNPREDVVNSYEDMHDFPEVADVGEVPVAIEYIPDQIENLSQYEFRETGEVYKFPDQIEAFLEPELNSLKQRFKNEGKFNWRKYRLEEFNDQDKEFVVSETSYFRSFATNFSPDLTFHDSLDEITLREAFKHQTIAGEEIVPLTDSPFSNHLGLVALVITRNGELMLTVRSKFVSVAANQLALPLSGGFDVDFFEGDNGYSLIDQEAKEDDEINLSDEELADSEAYFLGLVRRMDLLGKPDVMAILIVDELKDEFPTNEHAHRFVIDTGINHINNGEDLFSRENAEKIIASIEDEIGESGFEPTVASLSWIHTYKQNIIAD